MDDLTKLAREMAHWAALEHAAKARYATARTSYLAAVERTGLKLRAVDVELDGMPMASVTIAPVKTVVKVTDMTLFTKWVAENRPEQVVPMVRPGYIEAVEAKATAEPDVPPNDDGDIIPGLGVVQAGGGLTVTCTREFKHQVLASLELAPDAFDGDR